MQPTSRMWPRTAMNEAQHKIINLLETLFFPPDFLLVFVYLMCGLRQLFFFHCGPEMPKGCTLQLELPWGETEAGLQVRMYSHLALLTKEVSFWLFCIQILHILLFSDVIIQIFKKRAKCFSFKSLYS